MAALLGLDFETGGAFDAPPSENFITEIGAVLWDTDLNAPVKILSKLIRTHVEIPEEVTEYTKISKKMLDLYGENEDKAVRELMTLMLQADAIVAHNGNRFDKPLFENTLKRMYDRGLLLEVEYSAFLARYKDILWVDTMEDVDYPNDCKARSLTYLAGYHLLLNCFPHRSLTDVLTMFSILMKYDLNTVLGNAMEPKVVVRALVSFNDKDLAKKEKFGWENAGDKKYDKCWVKIMRQSEYEKVFTKWPFKSLIIVEA